MDIKSGHAVHAGQPTMLLEIEPHWIEMPIKECPDRLSDSTSDEVI